MKPVEYKPRAQRGAKAKLALAELLSALLPSAAFGTLAALIHGRLPGFVSISQMLNGLFGGMAFESMDNLNLLTALFYFAPPLLQLVFLGDRIPRELSQGVYSLTRERGRSIWLIKKLLWICLLSLLMSLFTLIPCYAYARLTGAARDELVPRVFAELMATWGLCHCMMVVLCNIAGMRIRPVYLLLLSMVLYASGLVLYLEGGDGAKLFPTVQGILYAHNSIFGKYREGFMTTPFSAVYQTSAIAALAAFGAVRIRKTDIL